MREKLLLPVFAQTSLRAFTTSALADVAVVTVSLHDLGGLRRQRRRLAKGEGLASSGIPLSESCILVWNRLPGELKAGWQYFKWDGSTWGVCQQLMGDYDPQTGTWGGYANTTRTSRMTVSYSFPAPPCALGYYATKTGSTVFYGGSWYGGNVPVWSGSHSVSG